jgi:hypothetical protein
MIIIITIFDFLRTIFLNPFMMIFHKNPLYFDYMGIYICVGVYKINDNLYSNIFWPLRFKKYMIRVIPICGFHGIHHKYCGPLVKSGKLRYWC